jgi:hypothetical protein
VKPRVKVTGPDGRRPAKCEATYWRKDGRVLVFVVQNAAVTGSIYGGGGVEGLSTRALPIEVELSAPATDVVDERTGKKLGDGTRFSFQFDPVSAVFFSFAEAE